MQPNTPAEAGDRSALEKAAKPEELGEVISYLAEKEKSLSNYSDKLRQSVVSVFDAFGDPDICRVCGGGKEYRQHHRFWMRKSGDGIDALPENGVLVSKGEHQSSWGDPQRGTSYYEVSEHQHVFAAKVALTLDTHHTKLDKNGATITDYFLIPDGDDPADTCYFLAAQDRRLVIAENQRADPDDFIRDVNQPSDVSRYILKALVKSGAIISFLQQYAEEAEKAERDYSEVAEVAERLAKAATEEAS